MNCKDSCGCNTFIGFCYNEVKGYCKRCKHFFKYGYNSAGQSWDRLGMKCPVCGKIDELVTDDSHGVDIDVLRSLAESGLIKNEKRKKEMLEEVEELKRIHKMLNNYK